MDSYTKKLRFIHITKTGGSIIQHISQKNKLGWTSHKQNYTGHRFINLYLKNNFINKYDWFLTVRNPFTRIISTVNRSYKRFNEGQTGNIYVNKLKQLINEHKKKDLHLIFNLYITYSLNNLCEYGDHFTQQCKYIIPNININILKFENLEEDFNNLMKRYKLDIILPKKKYNTSKQVFKLKNLNKQNILLIQKIYHKDFITFGYEFNIPNLK